MTELERLQAEWEAVEYKRACENILYEEACAALSAIKARRDDLHDSLAKANYEARVARDAWEAEIRRIRQGTP